MAEITATAGTGPIATGASTPIDKLLEQLVNSTIAPTINSLLDVTGTTTKDSTESSTGTKTSTETGTGTKTSSTSVAAQTLLDQQIASLQASLTDNNQYGQLIGNIMNEAAKGFNPTNAVSRRSGAYNSTTLDQLRNDAAAKATSQASEAVLADKRAKLTQLVELIGQNVNANKTESTSTSQAGTTNVTQVNTGTEKATVEANRIGSGAANAAKIGGAALLAKSLLDSDGGKSLTSTGISALKKIFDAAGTSGAIDAGAAQAITDALSGAVGTLGGSWDLGSLLGTSDAWSSLSNNAMSGFYADPFTGAALGSANLQDTLGTWLTSSGAFGSDAAAATAAESGISSSLANLLGNSSSSSLLSGASGAAGAFSALTNLADGQWGWKDTGSTAGAAIGSIFGPLGSAAGSAIGGAIGEPIGDIVEGAGGIVSDVVDSVGGFIDDLFGGGCFITTACMKALQAAFDDKCHELEAMRNLRDNYIQHLPVGKEIIEAYYLFAPEIVKRIESFDNAAEIWAGLYETFISICVSYVDEGQYKKAYLTYLHMIQYVQLTTGVGE